MCQNAKKIVSLLLLALTCILPLAAQEARWKEVAAQVIQLCYEGKFAEATPLAQESLRIAEATYGPEHLNVARSLNNLAVVYYKQGRYAEAEPLLKRALALHQKVQGPDHPDVATALCDLAALYYVQGRYADAEPLYQRALTIRQKVLGPEDPDVKEVADNLALIRRKLGRSAEAKGDSTSSTSAASAEKQEPATQDDSSKTKDGEPVTVQLQADGIEFQHAETYFYAPYTVQKDDTYYSLAERFYGDRSTAVQLAQVNGAQPGDQLQPSSIVYIASESFRVGFGNTEKQRIAVAQFLKETGKQKMKLKWDSAKVDMDLTAEGKWILKKFEASRIVLYGGTSDRPRLEVSFDPQPLLSVITGKTVANDVRLVN